MAKAIAKKIKTRTAVLVSKRVSGYNNQCPTGGY
jgi:hypothetical protein